MVEQCCGGFRGLWHGRLAKDGGSCLLGFHVIVRRIMIAVGVCERGSCSYEELRDNAMSAQQLLVGLSSVCVFAIRTPIANIQESRRLLYENECLSLMALDRSQSLGISDLLWEAFVDYGRVDRQRRRRILLELFMSHIGVF